MKISLDTGWRPLWTVYFLTFFGLSCAHDNCLQGNLFRVDGDRGLVERLPRSVQVCLHSTATAWYSVLINAQELVNLAPFVLDDGSIVTGEFDNSFSRSSTSNVSQGLNLLRAWS